MRCPAAQRLAISAAVRRAFVSCSGMVPFSPARMSELPPTAIRMVFIISSARTKAYPACQTQLAQSTSLRQPVFLGVQRLLQLHETGQSHELASHQFQQNGLLSVQTILCLLEDERSLRIDHIVGHLVSPVCGQAMKENGVGLGLGEE